MTLQLTALHFIGCIYDTSYTTGLGGIAECHGLATDKHVSAHQINIILLMC